MKKWERQLLKVQNIKAKGGSIVLPRDGVKLKGGALGNYVEKLQERISVIRCLAEQDEIRTAGAEDLNEFSTAAGSSEVEVATVSESDQMSQARAAFKSAESALRAGNRERFDVAMKRLREVLGE